MTLPFLCQELPYLAAPKFSSACTWNYAQGDWERLVVPAEVCRSACFTDWRNRPQGRSPMPRGPRDHWTRRQDSKTELLGPSPEWPHWSLWELEYIFASQISLYLLLSAIKTPCPPVVLKPSASRSCFIFPPDPTWTPCL